jgi:rod shape-determining protein MreD
MKVWLIARTLLSGVILLYLQVLIMPRLAIAGIIPNLFLGWIVYQVWSKPMQFLIPIIFVLGICFDLTTPNLLGLQTILFILLAVGVDEFHRPLEKDSFVTMAITLGLGCIAYSLLMFIVYGILSGFTGKLVLLLLGMFLYNLLTAICVTSAFVFVSHLRLDFRHGKT